VLALFGKTYTRAFISSVSFFPVVLELRAVSNSIVLHFRRFVSYLLSLSAPKDAWLCEEAVRAQSMPSHSYSQVLCVSS